jgi:hypothetical protein
MSCNFRFELRLGIFGYFLEKMVSEIKWPPLSPCPPSHLGTWLCEGGEHGSDAAVSGKLEMKS